MGLTTTWDRPHTEPDPEKALALTVIAVAIQDASHRPGANGTPHDQREARLFLFSTSGLWAEARRDWCEVADIEEEWLRRRLKEQGFQEEIVQVRPRSLDWDADALAFLREKKCLGSSLAEIARILNAAGFSSPRGGLVTPDTIVALKRRNADAFAG